MLKRKLRFMYVLILVVFLIVPMISSCTTLQGRRAYLIADKEFTTTLQKYNAYYKAADDATKAKWKENIDPLFRKANRALDLWGTASRLGVNGDPAAAEKRYLELKAELFKLLIESKIIE